MTRKRSNKRNMKWMTNNAGHKVGIDINKIPDDQWTIFTGETENGVQTNCGRAHIPEGVDRIILGKTNAPGTMAFTFDEYELIAGKRRLNKILANADRPTR